ncbi:MAG: hypothetical protein LAP38_16450 [Acidobacteriia bacterium]|nr:hypothetical protein [Terriglobia bacterium]
MARIIVGSYLVQFPLGGYMSWVGQWLLGFQRLGHEVWLVERSYGPNSCYDPSSNVMTDDCSYGTAQVGSFLARHGLEKRWCFVDFGKTYHGCERASIEDVLRAADLFVDMGSHGLWLDEAASIPLRVFVDGEPGYRQMMFETTGREGHALPEYERYYSVGLNVGTPACIAPDAGKHWRPIFDPVVTDLFSCEPPPTRAPFTTVMSWQAHSPIEFNGVTYGQKDVEFAKFMDLPCRVKAPMELAISGKNTPIDLLKKQGWRLLDSFRVTLTFDSWQDYIRGSRGEFSVAKNVFVATNSGFFSDRSAAYLASGRPVVMQETGFSAHLPCGSGLFAVRNVEEAAAAIDSIESDYTRHSRDAREIAVEYLDTRRVLGNFLRELGL